MDAGESYAEVFSSALVDLAAHDDRIVAITAAMPGPTGLLAFKDRYPERFMDVGIAEQHALTTAAGMAMGGLRPVVAIFSTFLGRAVDQWNLDVGLHGLPIVICAGRAGITGDDGPSHHGIYDLVQALQIPGCAIFCPAETAEVAPMLAQALELDGPSLIRIPKTPSPGPLAGPGTGLKARRLRKGTGEVVLVGIGKMTRAVLAAAEELFEDGIDTDVFDARVVRPADPEMLEAMARARLVVTAEDGLAHGGAGQYLVGEADRVADAAALEGPRQVVLGVPTRVLAARQARRDPLPARPGRRRDRGGHPQGARKAQADRAGAAGRTARADLRADRAVGPDEKGPGPVRTAGCHRAPPPSPGCSSTGSPRSGPSSRASLSLVDTRNVLSDSLATGRVSRLSSPEPRGSGESHSARSSSAISTGMRSCTWPTSSFASVVRIVHVYKGRHGLGVPRFPPFPQTAHEEQAGSGRGPEAPGLLAPDPIGGRGRGPFVKGVGGDDAALPIDRVAEHRLVPQGLRLRVESASSY